jgi:tetratricopeptide (TPR) repeat protein
MGKASREKKTEKENNTDQKPVGCENIISKFLQKPILHILLIAAVGLIAYSNTFNVPFHLDDSYVIVKNPIIKDMHFFAAPSKAEVFKGYFEYETFRLRYIGFLTFALNYKLHGLNVAGYHILNLAVHIINALLVYWLVLLTLNILFLFVSHPLQTQAVTYIWQRVTSLATMFYLFSLVMYIKGRLIAQNPEFRIQNAERRSSLSSVFCYMLSFLSAAAAMKTKEIAFTLPLIIVLYEFMFFEGKIKRRILPLIPVVSTILIIPLTLLGTDRPLGELISDVSEVTKVETTMSRLDYLFTQFRVIVTYIRLLFLPMNQNLDYDYSVYHSFFDLNVLLSFFFLSALLGIGVYLLYRSRPASHHSRLIAFGIFWFFITLSIESSFIPILDVIFEHRIYLPSVGFILACITGLGMLAEKTNSKVIVRVIVAGVITAVLMLGGTTYGRNRVWQNEITLWEDVVRKSPDKFRPYLNLGIAYANQDRLDEAISAFKTALLFRPDFANAHNDIGNIYVKQNRLNEAISAFKTATQFKPDYAEAYNNLGNAYDKQNRFDEAISAFKTATQFKPDYAEAYNNLGIAYAIQNRLNEAISAFKTATQFKPDYAEAYNNLGIAYAIQNRLNESISAYNRALQFRSDYADAYYNLGNAYAKQNRLDEAINKYKSALKFRPDHAEARKTLKLFMKQ